MENSNCIHLWACHLQLRFCCCSLASVSIMSLEWERGKEATRRGFWLERNDEGVSRLLSINLCLYDIMDIVTNCQRMCGSFPLYQTHASIRKIKQAHPDNSMVIDLSNLSNLYCNQGERRYFVPFLLVMKARNMRCSLYQDLLLSSIGITKHLCSD